jgi:hypothetical protein
VRQPSFSICAFIAAAVLYSIPAHAAEKSPVEVIEDDSFFIEKACNHLVQTVYPARRIQSCRDFWSDHSEFITGAAIVSRTAALISGRRISFRSLLSKARSSGARHISRYNPWRRQHPCRRGRRRSRRGSARRSAAPSPPTALPARGLWDSD